MYNMDRLWEAAAEKGNVCVGLDTAADYVPPRERARAASGAEAVLAFNRAIIDATIDAAACYKVQIACYEEAGLAGLRTYAETLSYIRARGALVIADCKRGDISDTARRYAKAHFDGDFEADFVTLSPYMGMDTIEPWLSWAETKGKGAFVLLLTSNPGMRDFEFLTINQDATGRGGRRLYDVVGEKLSIIARRHQGVHGYGAFGAVAGCTDRNEAARIREKYDSLFFLIPGYGAQGGAADDAAALLRDGNGGVVNASRSILCAWTEKAGSETGNALEDADNAFAARAAREAVIAMRGAIRAAAAVDSAGNGP
ncbi:MAG: orotidine-5'-phosphate decarboxylase [Spirochaetaceae bacterium]|jgi:orotidine-5'-phosphate decarboxylase|nr:orotidine-5'-phosphate decarboxylase [Spirochaetaceae bacterium]